MDVTDGVKNKNGTCKKYKRVENKDGIRKHYKMFFPQT